MDGVSVGEKTSVPRNADVSIKVTDLGTQYIYMKSRYKIYSGRIQLNESIFFQ